MIDLSIQLFTKYQAIFIWLGTVSAIIFVLSLLLTPFLIGQIPSDYFVSEAFRKQKLGFWFVLKNALGLILLLAGLIMLITPGQGILAIMLGLFLMQFPGKRGLELKLINHDPTFNALNWLRNKVGKTAFKR